MTRKHSLFWLILFFFLSLPIDSGADEKKKGPTPDELIAKYEALNLADSLNAESHFQLGNAYYDKGRLEGALREYRTATRLDPKLYRAYTNLGALLNEMGKGKEAIEVFKKVLDANPKDALARSNLGNAYYGEKKYGEAVREFMRVLKDDPKCYQAYYNLGVAFADAQIYREAIRMWEKVASISPDTQAAKEAKDNIKVLKEMTGSR